MFVTYDESVLNAFGFWNRLSEFSSIVVVDSSNMSLVDEGCRDTTRFQISLDNVEFIVAKFTVYGDEKGVSQNKNLCHSNALTR